jgi:hypothetical protein
MKLTKKAIDAINENGRIRNLIAAELNCSEASVRRWVEKNDDDNDLTKISCLNIISAETGLEQDEILEKVAA